MANNSNRKFLREKGRIRHTEKTFDVVMGDGTPNPDCTHGWYRTARYGATRIEQCVLCSLPRTVCEEQLRERNA